MDLSLTQLYRTPHCGSSNCPTFYETNRGTYAVQGWDLPAGAADVPAGEGIVEIPADVFEAIGRRWAAQNGLG